MSACFFILSSCFIWRVVVPVHIAYYEKLHASHRPLEHPNPNLGNGGDVGENDDVDAEEVSSSLAESVCCGLPKQHVILAACGY